MQSDQSYQTPHEVNCWQLKKRQDDCSEGKKNGKKKHAKIKKCSQLYISLQGSDAYLFLAIAHTWMCFTTIWHKFMSYTNQLNFAKHEKAGTKNETPTL